MIILLALDHTRDFVGVPGVNPTDPAQTTVLFFFTRWITHFCAPVVFLLTGVGAQLLSRKLPARDLSRYSVTRGLALICLELTLLRCLGFQFNFDYRFTMLNVLRALGFAMLALSALIHLPLRVIAGLTLAAIAGHNLLDGLRLTGPLWSILHRPGFVLNVPGDSVFVAYPLIPWFAVTAAGLALGCIYAFDPPRRRRFLFGAGFIATASFLLLRALNVYGDPTPWSSRASVVFTELSFLNTNKYPPSLLFLLMTLGPALVFLGAANRGTPGFLRPVLVFGRTPLFFFLLHIPLLHVIATALFYARYSQVHWMFASSSVAEFLFTPPPGWGLSLPATYAAWIAVVAVMYPLCRWFASLKRRSDAAWLRYV